MKTRLPFFRGLSWQPLLFNGQRLAALILVFFGISHYSPAQSKVWEKVLGGTGRNELKSVQSTRDGGYILGGTSGSGFTLSQPETATIKIYDGQGNEVATLFQGETEADRNYEVEWKAGNKPANLYFIQLQTATKWQQYKLLLSK
ncbi:hypothetical protein [Adhaeribacter radiodurans]|uniref:T9SS type A sorting domain-containing protein n=1 Tax=Adhaeribacter radiodurans TaxID=2745197 RepID=A0A7L7L9M2_9BACT|nr:hypothetical protein [Adhaeribacter radiodurans]QMU29531.1 hypothetical protein HUW48_16470 [Adhaeribacter radiodurans]